MDSLDNSKKQTGKSEAFNQYFELSAKIGSIIVLIMWVITTFSQLSIHAKYKISYSFFSLNLVDSIPVVIMASCLIILLATPAMFGLLHNQNQKKFKFYIFTTLISLLFAALNYEFYVKLSLDIPHNLIRVIMLLQIPGFLGYQHLVFMIKELSDMSKSDKQQNFSDKKIKNRSIIKLFALSVITVILIYMTLINIFGLVLEKKTNRTYYDIVEKDDTKRVIVLKYNDSFITQDYRVNGDTIIIDTNQYYIVEPIDATIYTESYFYEKIE